jgi:small subunit ribosomal protein S2
MKPFIFGERANIHIMDLSQTVPLLHQALVKVREVAAKGGRILFVGTKRQASEPIAAGRSALRAVLHESPLARRHADQLVRPSPTPSRACASWKALLDAEGGPQA